MKVSYNWLKWYIPKAPSPEKLADVFTYHLCEVEGIEKIGEGEKADWIFDINILPNRAHDLLSHMGVAREIASLLGIACVDPTEKYKVPATEPTKFEIKIETDKCRRYMGRVIRNVSVGPSPEWVKMHLESIGQRSINNVVDASNLVMYNCGQPTHAFDLDKLTAAKITIRSAKEGEEMTTLDNKHIKFSEKDMVIADEGNVLAIAGVKGGKSAEVDNNTKNIVLEIANFDPVSVRKTAQSFNIFTDARKRFENDLSPELGPHAMLELSALIAEMCPEATFEDVVDVYPQKQAERTLSFSAERVSSILGLSVSPSEIAGILKRYNLLPDGSNEGNFEITVPMMRLDLVGQEDMAEEIGRILGYDKVKPIIPKINFTPRKNETHERIAWARNKLHDDGYSEVMTYSFADKGEREVLESPSDKKFLRTNISDGLKESVKLNQLNAAFLETDKVRVFEIGAVFLKDREIIHVAFGDSKNVKEMTLAEFSKEFSLGERGASGTPEVPEASAKNLNELDGQKSKNEKFKIWSLYPFISRDVAVWVPAGEGSEKLLALLKENATDLLVKDPYLFDSFTKEGRTSYAFRLVFQSYDRTLTDEEVNKVMEAIQNKIAENPDWEIR